MRAYYALILIEQKVPTNYILVFKFKLIYFFIILIAACSDILKALKEPQNAERLAQAKESAGTDMVKVMREVFPIVTEVQLEVISNYGFSADGDG